MAATVDAARGKPARSLTEAHREPSYACRTGCGESASHLDQQVQLLLRWHISVQSYFSYFECRARIDA